MKTHLDRLALWSAVIVMAILAIRSLVSDKPKRGQDIVITVTNTGDFKLDVSREMTNILSNPYERPMQVSPNPPTLIK